MKLSIITINLNNKQGLEKTIASVMSQTWRDFEWIIIDGGSTDGSKDVIANLAKNPASNISYWCSEKDGGIYQALNKGVRFAQGEYVNFMNAGDIFHNATVLKDVFVPNPVSDILYGDTMLVSTDNEMFQACPERLTFSWFYQGYTICHQSSFTKRNIFDGITFDTKYLFLADRKFWMECMLKGYSFQYCHVIISNYDCEGFSSKNTRFWNGEQQRIHNDVIPIGLKDDIDNSVHFQKILYKPEMEMVSMYGRGTLKAYDLMVNFFFKIMKIRLFNGCCNLIYKLTHKRE